MTSPDDNTGNQLDRRLGEWGASETPPVDGAFANRLEVKLRQSMITEPAGARAGWSALLFRPSVIVVGLAVVIFGFAMASRSSDQVGLADGTDSTVPIAPTTTDDRTTTTSAPEGSLVIPPITGTQGLTDEQIDAIVSSIDALTTTVPVAPTTTDELTPTTSDETTIPRTTTVPNTDAGPTTTGVETTIPAASSIDLTIRRDGRQVIASWTLRREIDSIVSWVLIASIDGDGDLIASSRDPAIRTLTGRLTDLDQTLRVEGRDREGVAIVTSEEVQVSRDG